MGERCVSQAPHRFFIGRNPPLQAVFKVEGTSVGICKALNTRPLFLLYKMAFCLLHRLLSRTWPIRFVWMAGNAKLLNIQKIFHEIWQMNETYFVTFKKSTRSPSVPPVVPDWVKLYT